MISKLREEIVSTLTISELDALRYIDNNKEKVLTQNISELAKDVYVSTATIMRLCKKIGLSGFSELKYILKEEINECKSCATPSTFEEITERNIQDIADAVHSIDEKKVMEIVELLKGDYNVHFFAKGLTEVVAAYASKLLFSNMRANSHYTDTHIAYIAAENMGKKDLIFLASQSGNTHQVVRVAQIAKSRGAIVVTITGCIGNALSKIGDYNFTAVVYDGQKYTIDMISRIPLLVVFNIILMSYIESSREK